MSKENVTRRISIYVNGKEVENSLKGVDGQIIHVKNSLRKLVEGTEDYDKKKSELTESLSKLTKRQKEYREELGLTNTGLNKVKNSLGSVATGILTAFSLGSVVSTFSSVISDAFQTNKKFEQGIADLSAITGVAGKDLNYLKNQAIELGEKTQGGAIAVVEAYKLIASAKPELLDNVEALNQVTEATIILAQASGMELPAAASALTDAMNQFGADASQATIFVDALANGAKYGAAEIPQVTDALLKFGAVARSSNVSIQESTALVELLAENGLKGADAGTALRNVLLKLSAPDALPKEAVDEFKKLGISVEFLKDKTIPIQEKFELLKPLLKDNASIVKVFGTENAVAAINVLDHTARLKELTSKMNEVGTAQEQAAIKMNTVQGKTELLKSQYDSLILSIGKGSGPVSSFFKFFIDGSAGALQGLLRLNSSWDELYNKASKTGAKIGEKTFQVQMQGKTGEDAEKQAEQNIRIARNNLKTLSEQIKETKKGIEEDSYFGPVSQLDGVRKTKVGLQHDLEKLVAIQAEYAKVLKMSKEYIIQSKIPPTNIKSDNNNTPLTDEEIKAAETAKNKKNSLEKKHNDEIIDQAIALAKAKADLSKAQLDELISENATKLKTDKDYSDASVQEEKNRLLAILNTQKSFFVTEEKEKLELANKNKKSDEEYLIEKLAIEKEYDTKRLDLKQKFDNTASELDAKNAEIKNQLKIEQLQAENELDVLLAETKFDEEAIKRKQAYDKEVFDYKTKLDKKLITDKQYKSAIDALDKKSKEMERVAEIQKIQGTLGGLNQVAGAIGEMFGQSKGLAIAQAGINGAMAVTSILAEYPKFDGGFAMWASIAAAGITTIAQIGKITSTKAPATPKFFYGGSTGNSPVLGNDEFGPVTGVVHSEEWVAPKIMTQSPKYAATFSWLENERKAIVGNKFFAGGETSPGTIPTFTQTTTDNENAILLALNKLNDHLDKGIKAETNIGYKQAREIQKLNDEAANSESYGTVNK